MELLEYYDEKNEKKLGIAERSNIHKNNLWHREVGIWILNEQNELLIQRRSPNKKSNPNKLSITAGHVDVNEREITAALREIKEEIGLDYNEDDLELIDIFKNEQEGNYCFSYTYLVKTNAKIEDMIMQEDEVSELKYITIEEVEERIKKEDDEMPLAKKASTKITIDKIKNIVNMQFFELEKEKNI